MALEVKQKASVCWFDVDFGLVKHWPSENHA